MTSPQDFLYTYPPLVAGKLRKRYKRFFADIELENGEIITAHCANTGPMTGVCQIDSPVYVSRSDNPKRKLTYTWEMIQIQGTWVGVNTSLPNTVVKLALEQRLLGDLVGDTTIISPEVPYGEDKKSRIDFLLREPLSVKPPTYIEVKNTTLAEGERALFPDTVTTRGQKHLRELMGILPEARALMLYFINREDCCQFSPGDVYDQEYGRLLRQGLEQGIEVLPCRFQISPAGIRYLGLATLKV
jgi:sugar fermentation stimulation protein A